MAVIFGASGWPFRRPPRAHEPVAAPPKPLRPRALVLSLDPDTRELEELVWSLGYDVVDVVVQKRDKPDPATYLGRGKIDEAAARALDLGCALVAVNAALKPGQVFALERHFRDAKKRRERKARLAEGDEDFVPLDAEALALDDAAASRPRPSTPASARASPSPPADVQVYDRLRLILDIFSERARSPEARLQVEYARLQYETPLVKEVIHLAKKGEHPGFLGGGRYEVNYYYMMMRSRMARIRRELDRISQERDVRRRHRRRGGFRLVSLAGYTNAGKSSLLEALADTRTLVENRYFSTLATTTRRASHDGRTFLLTDTVGFIEDLPPWMVEAFHSTLEEIALSDCVLLAVDASEPLPEIERKLRSSLQVLATMHARIRGGRASAAPEGDRLPWRTAENPLVVVLNKVDLLGRGEAEAKLEALVELGLVPPPPRTVLASARERAGLEEVFRAVEDALPPGATLVATLPSGPATEALLAWLRARGRVEVRHGATVEIEATLEDRLLAEALGRVAEAGGRVLPEGPLPEEGPAGPGPISPDD